MTPLDDMELAELQQRASDYQLDVPKNATRAQLQAALRAYFDDIDERHRIGVLVDRANGAARARAEGRH